MPHVFETVTVAAGMLGLGKGTPVVMLHASLSCKSQWDTLADTLAARYQPMALDLVGYGANALPFLVMVDKDGLVAHTWKGYPGSKLDLIVEQINGLLDESAQTGPAGG